MVTLCHALDDCEVMFLRAILEINEIQFFIIGEHFGALYPGIQIPSYNERRFVAQEEQRDQARAILSGHRKTFEPTGSNLAVKSKLRIIIETFLFGWCVPNGTKQNH